LIKRGIKNVKKNNINSDGSARDGFKHPVREK
jgi:hypothetical protein